MRVNQLIDIINFLLQYDIVEFDDGNGYMCESNRLTILFLQDTIIFIDSFLKATTFKKLSEKEILLFYDIIKLKELSRR